MAYETSVPLIRLTFSDGFKYYGAATTITASVTVNLSVPVATHNSTGESLTDGQVLPSQDVDAFDVPRIDQSGWRTPNGSTLSGWSYDVALTITATGKPSLLWAATIHPRNNPETITPGMGTLVGDPAGAGGGGAVAGVAGTAKNTVVLFGTSLEAQNGGGGEVLNPATGAAALSSRGWFHWANAYTGNQLSHVRNAGVGGNTYAQMLARIDTDVLAHDSDWVFLGGPTNDTSGGRSTAAIIADANAILDKLEGRRVLILTGPPNSGHDTAAETATLFDVNAWIRRLPWVRKNVVVADAWRALSNGTSVSPAPGTAIDGVHYSAVGAARVGKVAADAVRPFLSPSPARSSSNVDPRRIIANPALSSGTGWSVLGAGVTAAYQPDEDTLTTKGVLTYAGVASTGNLGIQAAADTTTGLWAAGDIVQVSARVRWSGAVPLTVSSNFGPFILVTFRGADNTTVEHQSGFVPSDQNVVPVNAPKAGDTVITTARHTIPATMPSGSAISRVDVRVGFRGISDGTVTVSDVAAVKGA